jgi:hypothetical protein
MYINHYSPTEMAERRAAWLAQRAKDIDTLRDRIPELAVLNDEEVADLYNDWSESHYAAGWMRMDLHFPTDFQKWVTRSPIQLILAKRKLPLDGISEDF